MAVRFDRLYHAVTTFDNLFRAYRNAARGKRGQPQGRSRVASHDLSRRAW